MSDFRVPPGRALYNGSREQNEIREIFYQHWVKMREELDKATKNIDSWRLERIEEIEKYADQQLRHLKEDYDRQRNVFDEDRRANIDIAAAYVFNASNETKLFTQLRDDCRKLEFQVAQLEIIQLDLNFIKVITVEEQIKRKEKCSTKKESMKTSENNDGNVVSTLDPTLTNSDRTKQRSPIKEATNSDAFREGHSNNQKIHGSKDNNDHDNKCPICFMIYPASMKSHDRTRHANEHYADDT